MGDIRPSPVVGVRGRCSLLYMSIQTHSYISYRGVSGLGGAAAALFVGDIDPATGDFIPRSSVRNCPNTSIANASVLIYLTISGVTGSITKWRVYSIVGAVLAVATV